MPSLRLPQHLCSGRTLPRAGVLFLATLRFLLELLRRWWMKIAVHECHG